MTMPLSEEIQLFTSKADYELRPNFMAALTLKEGEVDRIVGKYELAANRALWAFCGLNKCNTEHRYGYVIRTVDGRETNIGHACGKRELGVSFEEVEAVFKRAEDQQARQRAIAALLQDKPALETRVKAGISAGRMQQDRLSAFVHTFSSLSGFWREVQKAAKQGGIVRGAMKKDKEWSISGSKETLVTLARFEGAAVLVTDMSDTPNLAQKIFMPWLDLLHAENLGALDEASLGKFVIQAANMKGLLARLEEFVAASTSLLTVDNIAGLEPICDHVLRSNDAGYARAVLRAWLEAARTSGIPTDPIRIHRP